MRLRRISQAAVPMCLQSSILPGNPVVGVDSSASRRRAAGGRRRAARHKPRHRGAATERLRRCIAWRASRSSEICWREPDIGGSISGHRPSLARFFGILPQRCCQTWRRGVDPGEATQWRDRRRLRPSKPRRKRWMHGEIMKAHVDEEFKSYRSYRNFALSVERCWRYVLPPESAAFLQAVLATSANKEEAIAEGSIFYRAQLGHDWEPEMVVPGVSEDFPAPFSPERMKPLRDRAFEGRANAKGIAYLYAATHQQTAIAEVRPWVGGFVSVAQLRITRDLRVMDCSTDDHRMKIYLDEPPPEERQSAVWRDIDRAFSEPVTASDDVASYAATQILAEAFRQQGFDGIGYRSALGPGHNVAFFDPDVADVINCSLVTIKRLTVEYTEASNPYFVTEHYPPADDGIA